MRWLIKRLFEFCRTVPDLVFALLFPFVAVSEQAPTFHAVTNAGNRPTFGEESFAVETHLLNFHPQQQTIDLHKDTLLELTFLSRIRSEMRFPSPEALKTQILRDVAHALRYFHLEQLMTAAPAKNHQ